MRPEIAVLSETYTAIATTLPQTRIEDSGASIISQGPFAHPLCNFALILKAKGIQEAVSAASGRPHFNIYTFESTGLFDVTGHKPTLAMRIMTAPPGFPSAPALEPVQTPTERLRLARFMAEQFFSGHRNDTRDRIAESTARSQGTALYAFNDEGAGMNSPEPVGAAMLSNHTGIAGLFNICVARAKRHRGFGSAIVRAMLNATATRGVATTLQCDTSLEHWYGSFGFKTVDTMTIWTASYED